MKEYRYEIKYNLNHLQLAYIEKIIYNETFFKKTFQNREVYSIYLDDSYLSSAKDNIIGVSERKKIRIRWYNNYNNYSDPIIELKIKKNKLGYKKYYRINLEKDINDFKNLNIFVSECLKKISYNHENIFLKDLKPVLIIGYMRKYFENEDNIRLTIDSNIKYRNFPIFTSFKNLKTDKYNKHILELKFDKDSKLNASKIINKISITPQRHSKYLVGLSRNNIINYL